MKLQKIKSLCSKSAGIMVYETEGCLWMGDNSSLYPIYNLPKLTDDQIYALFDIDEDKREKIRVARRQLPTSLMNFDDNDLTEVQLVNLPIAVEWTGERLIPFVSADRQIVYIYDEHLKPFDDMKTAKGLYLRKDSRGEPYIAVKKGLLLIGIILPRKVANNSKYAEALESLYIDVMKKSASENEEEE